MILKVRGGKVRGIVNVQALAAWLHDVAGKTERGPRLRGTGAVRTTQARC